jgi:SAM-dependent methyltransferase
LANAVLRASRADPSTLAQWGQSGRRYYEEELSEMVGAPKLADLLRLAARTGRRARPMSKRRTDTLEESHPMSIEANAEAERVDAIYSQRGYDTDPAYSDVNPVYLHRVHSMERVTLRAIKSCGLESRLDNVRVLDYGCGNGKWFGRWTAWGAKPENLYGVDVRPSALEMARAAFPQSTFTPLNDGVIPLPSASVDIGVYNLVFSSILDESIREKAASEVVRVLRPGGFVFLCDFTVDNPRNPDVRPLKIADVRRLFADMEQVYFKRVVLLAPLARRVVPRSWLAASILEAAFPLLRTHAFSALRKP